MVFRESSSCFASAVLIPTLHFSSTQRLTKRAPSPACLPKYLRGFSVGINASIPYDDIYLHLEQPTLVNKTRYPQLEDASVDRRTSQELVSPY